MRKTEYRRLFREWRYELFRRYIAKFGSKDKAAKELGIDRTYLRRVLRDEIED